MVYIFEKYIGKSTTKIPKARGIDTFLKVPMTLFLYSKASGSQIRS